MFKLEKQKTGSTPYIYIDEEQGYMRFQGESFHENVLEFYADIIAWLQGYLSTDFPSFTFDCELRYFNSSTAKMLLNMLLLMDEASAKGRKVTVNWITTVDNEINIECGEDFGDEVAHMDFKIVIHPA
ncbi:MAG: DUF1987 domain-containing protein [Candidatus Pelethousia sp.]|nr:DUF1987 domain-containing protein [Candidatus Pelethousia sp.]